jgi:hypothetical protein
VSILPRVRRYGLNKTTKVLQGRVLSSEKVPTSSGKTTQTLVTVQIDLGGGDKSPRWSGMSRLSWWRNWPSAKGCTSTGLTQFGALDPQDADGDPQEAPGPKRIKPSSSIPISSTIVTGELADSSNGDGEQKLMKYKHGGDGRRERCPLRTHTCSCCP